MTNGDLQQIVEESDRYVALLTRMAKLTDSVMDAVRNSALEGIGGILESRVSLCQEIGRSSSALNEKLEVARDARAPSGTDRGPAWERFEASLEKIQRLSVSLLGSQAECEKLLAEKLSQCRSELETLCHRRGLRTAYQDPASSRSARFLDSKR